MASIAVTVFRFTAGETITAIREAEQAGIRAVWLPTQPLNFDPMPTLAAAAALTTEIRLGPGIVPTYPRHPVALATEALAMADIAPGRFQLGIGPSHASIIQDALGIPFGRPLSHLREYLHVLRTLLWEGAVDFKGTYYNVQAALPPWATPPRTEVFISANRPNAFALAGDAADGLISSWAPLAYLNDVALPILRKHAEAAGRSRPRVVAHVPIIPSEDKQVVYDVARAAWAAIYQAPGINKPYAEMYRLTGLPLQSDGGMTEAIVDALFGFGDDEAISQRIHSLLAHEDIDEVMVTIHPVGDPVQDEARVLKLLGRLEAHYAKDQSRSVSA